MFKRWLSINTRKSCLIIGPRRSGKTTFFKTEYPDYKYTTLDDLDYLSKAKKDPKGFIQELGPKAIIDEIQRCPDLMIAVKYAIDNNYAVFLMTGSSSIGLLDKSVETLAGRINLYSLPTVCWGEEKGEPTHNIFSGKADRTDIINGSRVFNDVLTYGLFPEILIQDSINEKKAILNGYKNSYFTREIMSLSNIENLEGLLSIFHNIGRSIGSHLEVANFARESNISHITAKKYLNSLFQSQMTFKLYGYQYGPAKKYIKASKTYFADNSIITALNIQLNRGQLVENFVISELEKRRKLGFIRAEQFYYYKSAAGREIDLIFETGQGLSAIEIKATSNPSVRDVSNLNEFARQSKKKIDLYLFYLGEEYKEINGVKILPIFSLYRGK